MAPALHLAGLGMQAWDGGRGAGWTSATNQLLTESCRHPNANVLE